MNQPFIIKQAGSTIGVHKRASFPFKIRQMNDALFLIKVIHARISTEDKTGSHKPFYKQSCRHLIGQCDIT
jgi:hypothetical protein